MLTRLERCYGWRRSAGPSPGPRCPCPEPHAPRVDLYGAARVAEEWSSDGSMRARVRWRVKQALKLMNGG